MAGERLNRTEIGDRGLHGDRGWAAGDEETGEIYSAKRCPALMQRLEPATNRAVYRRHEPGAALIGLAHGCAESFRALSSDRWAWSSAVSRTNQMPDLGDLPAVVFEFNTPPGTFSDLAPRCTAASCPSGSSVWELYFENDATGISSERAMNFSWRPAGIVACLQPEVESSIIKPPDNHKDLFGETRASPLKTRRRESIFVGGPIAEVGEGALEDNENQPGVCVLWWLDLNPAQFCRGTSG